MDRFMVYGGHRLEGSLRASGAKNAVLPILAAVLLNPHEVALTRVPRIVDVDNMLSILVELGCSVTWAGPHELVIDASTAVGWVMPEQLAREMRSSIVMLGSILGRFGKAQLTYPGGCEIGLRPIDLHLSGLQALGAVIVEEGGHIECRGQLHGGSVTLDYPSVGATENIILATVLTSHTTVIRNAALEPEIVDLQGFLNACGAKVSGAGTATVTVEGVEALHGCTYEIMADRIEAGTYLIAAAITQGDVTVTGVQPGLLQPVLAKLREGGCVVDESTDWIRARATNRPSVLRAVQTRPYPGFPTDMQAQFMVYMTIMQGTGMMEENIFENRYKHSSELIRMGADIIIRDRNAIIHGVPRLKGARVAATDLRGGACLVLAGLQAEGCTLVENAHLIDRGYESLDQRLVGLGGAVERLRSE